MKGCNSTTMIQNERERERERERDTLEYCSSKQFNSVRIILTFSGSLLIMDPMTLVVFLSCHPGIHDLPANRKDGIK
jgi:hypothetical protein